MHRNGLETTDQEPRGRSPAERLEPARERRGERRHHEPGVVEGADPAERGDGDPHEPHDRGCDHPVEDPQLHQVVPQQDSATFALRSGPGRQTEAREPVQQAEHHGESDDERREVQPVHGKAPTEQVDRVLGKDRWGAHGARPEAPQRQALKHDHHADGGDHLRELLGIAERAEDHEERQRAHHRSDRQGRDDRRGESPRIAEVVSSRKADDRKKEVTGRSQLGVDDRGVHRLRAEGEVDDARAAMDHHDTDAQRGVHRADAEAEKEEEEDVGHVRQ